uniref:nucleotidyltransferase substrate binding protein n=1 Tax=Prevotella sp. TaxID=59823 RepID=UPI004028A6BC
MEKGSDNIRWRQRLATFQRALGRLEEVVNLQNQRQLSPLEKDGMVQRFEYTQELAWKVMKNYIEYQGGEKLAGSRDTIRQAFALEIITNTDPWFDMLESRNETSHVYDEDTENDVLDKITMTYLPIMQELNKRMSSIQLE